MAYTVAFSFDLFRENIEISGDNKDIAIKRRDRLISILKDKFEILEAFPSGSLSRNTAVKGSADLDIMVALHYSKHIEGKLPSKVLQEVRDALSEYRTNVRKNGQAVTLYYDTWPSVDIVPVSRSINPDKTVNHYNVPNMNNETWMQSRPKKHSTDMTEKNKTCGINFKRIVKMIKWWNHQHGSYLQSFHIEVLALKIFETELTDYSWDIYVFFKNAYELVQKSLWHEDSYIDNYLDYNNRQEALNRLLKARDKALIAWNNTYDENSNHEEAIKLWRQIFGDQFPPYG